MNIRVWKTSHSEGSFINIRMEVVGLLNNSSFERVRPKVENHFELDKGDAIRLLEGLQKTLLEDTKDWTAKGDRTNSSDLYLKMIRVVEALIKDSASDLICGNVQAVARMIVSQLVHKHGFRPSR